jgi:hypothetical protein
MSQFSGNGYSAKVEIWLDADSRRLSVAQVGEDSLLLRTPVDFVSAPQHARVVIVVDGDPREFPVLIRSCAGRLVEFDHEPAGVVAAERIA